MSAISTRRFVVTQGPNKGRTCIIAGHVFTDGRYAFRGNAEQVATLTKIFSYNGVEPDEGQEPDGEQRQQQQQAGGGSTDEGGGDRDLNDDGSLKGTQQQEQQPGAGERPSLGEAVASLDPDRAEHWTSNNLPSLEVLSSLTGTRVTRDQVNAIADGYTRAKAKAVKPA